MRSLVGDPVDVGATILSGLDERPAILGPHRLVKINAYNFSPVLSAREWAGHSFAEGVSYHRRTEELDAVECSNLARAGDEYLIQVGLKQGAVSLRAESVAVPLRCIEARQPGGRDTDDLGVG